jgi:hypothetical protein
VTPTGVMGGLVPAIRVFTKPQVKTWMPGTRPGMTRPHDAKYAPPLTWMVWPLM